MDQAVTISDFIRPICLPTVPGVLSQDRLWFVTGWGRTSNNRRVPSDTLQQVQVNKAFLLQYIRISGFSSKFQ